jgi:predicted RNA-binding Zn ribbon-like protein
VEDERAPAPEPLEVVRAFVNTWDADEGTDALADPAVAAEWLGAHGLVEPGTRVREADRRRVVDLREALRAALLANNGEPLTEDAVATLNALAARSPLAARFDTSGTIGVTGERGGVDGAIGRLLAVVLQSVADGTWARLKACRDDDCQWVFYDRSRNRSSQWCLMAVCGNRNKARQYRARRQTS